MKFIWIILLVSLEGFSQQIEVVDFPALEKELKEKSDTIKVVNFWASWCGPCIGEMKYFVQAQEAYKNEKVKFIYVSLDFVKSLENARKVARKNGLRGELFLLKDNPDTYINQIDPSWEGQIPITLRVQEDGSYKLHLAAFKDFEELNSFIKDQHK